MKTVKVSSWIAKSWRDQTVGCYGRSQVVYSGRYRLGHLSVDACNQVNRDLGPVGVTRFHCRGHRLNVQSGPCKGRAWMGWHDHSPSSISLCKSMAYVIGVTEKEVPGSIGVPRHVTGSRPWMGIGKALAQGCA